MTQTFRHPGNDRERLRQFGLDKGLRVLSDFNYLRHTQPEIFRLLDQTLRTPNAAGFGRVYEIESHEIFGVFDANMKAIAVVRAIRHKLTVFKRDPLFRFPAGKSGSSQTNNAPNDREN